MTSVKHPSFGIWKHDDAGALHHAFPIRLIVKMRVTMKVTMRVTMKVTMRVTMRVTIRVTITVTIEVMTRVTIRVTRFLSLISRLCTIAGMLSNVLLRML